jgi:hypothetical protein
MACHALDASAGSAGGRLHEIPDRRHVQAGLERRGSLLRIRYAPRRDRSAEHHAQNHIRMPAGVIRNHPAVIRPSKQDHLIQLATAAHQVQIFHLGCQSHLAPRIVEHHGAVSHQTLQIAREPSGVGNRERTAAVAELAKVYGYSARSRDRSFLHYRGARSPAVDRPGGLSYKPFFVRNAIRSTTRQA